MLIRLADKRRRNAYEPQKRFKRLKLDACMILDLLFDESLGEILKQIHSKSAIGFVTRLDRELN
jgi:hypothetical protein